MKKRKGFHSIVVSGLNYQYCITNQGVGIHEPHGVVIYDSNENKHHIKNLHTLGIPSQGSEGERTWRGKHRECAWGKHQIAWVIKKFLQLDLHNSNL